MGLSQTAVALIWRAFGLQPAPPADVQALRNWFARHPRFHVHFTPTSASWLNQVERWFATLTTELIRRGTHRSTRQLEPAIRHCLNINNANPKPFQSTKPADEILAGMERFFLRTSSSAH